MTDPLVWPLARLTLDEDTGETLKASIHAGHNDDMTLEVDELSLVGRTDAGRGPAQRVDAVAPLRLSDAKLFIDLALIGDYASDAAAAAAGVPVGGVYRAGSALRIRVS